VIERRFGEILRRFLAMWATVIGTIAALRMRR